MKERIKQILDDIAGGIFLIISSPIILITWLLYERGSNVDWLV